MSDIELNVDPDRLLRLRNELAEAAADAINNGCRAGASAVDDVPGLLAVLQLLRELQSVGSSCRAPLTEVGYEGFRRHWGHRAVNGIYPR